MGGERQTEKMGGDGWYKGWSRDLQTRSNSQKRGFREKGGKKGYDEPRFDESGRKIYVANLPEDIEESALEYVFGTYGTAASQELSLDP